MALGWNAPKFCRLLNLKGTVNLSFIKDRCASKKLPIKMLETRGREKTGAHNLYETVRIV